MLPLRRLRFTVVAHSPIRLPDYAGSLLRGAFGQALRQVACITRAKDCAPCPLRSGCPYSAVFAPGKAAPAAPGRSGIDIPAPYVVEPPAWGVRVVAPGESFQFHMVLIGRAIDHLPIIVLAWRRALARGLGPGDGVGDLERIDDESGAAVFRAANGEIALTPFAVPPAPTLRDGARHVTLHLLTPLRLQENGRALPPERLGARALILAAARRANLLWQFHGNLPPPTIDWTQLAAEADALQETRRLLWRDWTRYSSRQKTTMTLGGVVGEWRLSGALAHAEFWLHIGQWLHIGKETAFGLGAYRLETPGAQAISPLPATDCEAARQRIEFSEKRR